MGAHRSPTRSVLSSRLSGKRRESIVCSTDGGERRIVDKWGDKGSESQEHRETCSRGDKEMFQDLPQEWTGSTRFRKSWEVLSNYESENRESTGRPVAATSNKRSHQQETTHRWMRTVASLTFDPIHSKAKGGTSEIEKISAKFCG